MIHQLRIYEVNPELKQQFHDRFKTHALKIMKSYGFEIISMWESEYEGRTEFVYLLRWFNEETCRQQWEKFMADEAWAEIKRRSLETTGELVLAKVRDQVLHTVDYAKEL